MDDIPLFCQRCQKELRPGRGTFYVVRIEAFADPTPPSISDEQLAERDANSEIQDLFEQLRGMSERELMDQVYRRVIIHLCTPCYAEWIEDPAG